jgi:hypothetical protein
MTMFAVFRKFVSVAALSGAALGILTTGSGKATASALPGFELAQRPVALAMNNSEPMWILYYWKANDPDASIDNRVRHNCGRGLAAKIYARQLQSDLRGQGYNAVIVPEYGE